MSIILQNNSIQSEPAIKPQPTKHNTKATQTVSIDNAGCINQKNTRIEILKGEIAEKKELLKKISVLLEKQHYSEKDKKEYIILTQSKTKEVIYNIAGVATALGGSTWFYGALLKAGALVTGVGGACLVGGFIILAGIYMYNEVKKGNIGTIENLQDNDSRIRSELQEKYNEIQAEIQKIQKEINRLKQE